MTVSGALVAPILAARPPLYLFVSPPQMLFDISPQKGRERHRHTSSLTGGIPPSGRSDTATGLLIGICIRRSFPGSEVGSGWPADRVLMIQGTNIITKYVLATTKRRQFLRVLVVASKPRARL
jgi:hypothetical protein